MIWMRPGIRACHLDEKIMTLSNLCVEVYKVKQPLLVLHIPDPRLRSDIAHQENYDQQHYRCWILICSCIITVSLSNSECSY